MPFHKIWVQGSVLYSLNSNSKTNLLPTVMSKINMKTPERNADRDAVNVIAAVNRPSIKMRQMMILHADHLLVMSKN